MGRADPLTYRFPASGPRAYMRQCLFVKRWLNGGEFFSFVPSAPGRVVVIYGNLTNLVALQSDRGPWTFPCPLGAFFRALGLGSLGVAVCRADAFAPVRGARAGGLGPSLSLLDTTRPAVVEAERGWRAAGPVTLATFGA